MGKCNIWIFPEKVRRALKSTLFDLMLAASVAVRSLGAQALGTDSVAAKEETVESPVVVDAVCGHQNTAKGGRLLSLKIELFNQSDQVLNGTLCILVMESDFQGCNVSLDYGVYQYEYPVEIEPGGNMNKSVSISLRARVDQIYMRLLDENGDEVISKRLKLDLNLETAELFIGVLSDSPAELLYFNGVGINYSTLRTKTTKMTTSTLSASELGLDQLDVLLITDFGSGKLSGQQIEAMWGWVRKGGALLIGTGERGEGTLRGFGKELLRQPLPQPDERVISMGVEYAVDRPEDTSIPLVCTGVMLKGGTEVPSSDELSVLSSVSAGGGLMAAVMYDFVDIERFCQANISHIDNLFTTLLGEDKINGLTSAMDNSISSRFWSVQGLINTGDINNLPKVGLYVTLAVAYITLAESGLYFFWKQRGMRQYYQLSVGIPSLCCTGTVLLVGMNARFTGPLFTYATVKDTDRSKILEATFINVRAPYNKPYSITLNPEYTLYPIMGSVYHNMGLLSKFTGEETPSITIHYSEEGARLRSDNVGAFSSKFFMMERRTEDERQEGFTGDVNSFDGKVTGTLTNNYNQEVDSVAILLYDQMILIGHMEPSETVSLDDMGVIYGITNFDYAATKQIIGASRCKEDKDIRDAVYMQALERTNLLSFYMGSYLPGYHSEARVLGFNNEKGETEFSKSSSYEACGSTLLTSSIDVSYKQDGMIYRSALQKQPNVLSDEYYESNNNIYGLTPAILEYYLGNDIEVEKLSFHQMSNEVMKGVRYYYTVPFTDNIYFYNYNTGTYDSMGTHVQSCDREDLEPYLSPDSTLTIKYMYDATGDYTWNIMLSILTVTGRSK